jgi:hypothetical protein
MLDGRVWVGPGVDSAAVVVATSVVGMVVGTVVDWGVTVFAAGWEQPEARRITTRRVMLPRKNLVFIHNILPADI